MFVVVLQAAVVGQPYGGHVPPNRREVGHALHLAQGIQPKGAPVGTTFEGLYAKDISTPHGREHHPTSSTTIRNSAGSL